MNTTVTRAMLCDAATRQTGLDKADVSNIAETMFEMMREALMAGENVKLTKFGALQVRSRAERIGRNPRTGAEHVITERHTVVFTPSGQLRDSLDFIASTGKVGQAA
ncbi:integration host factor subunit alpha [Devosia sp. 2618]|uniref:integration host factor subunit alpha n=1 Tax=Devosia sp. 2618 TaxID=3156454 RepID=UPI0033965F38